LNVRSFKGKTMSPRTAEQNQALREESRARIVGAALGLFGAHGYEGTSVRMIAEAAGVAQGLMYSHFASKEELLRAIFQQSIQDVYASFAAAEAGDPGQGPVERIIRAAFATLRERLDFWRLSYGVRMQHSVIAALGDDLPDWAGAIRANLERALRESGAPQPDVAAAILFATIDGVAQHFVLDPEGYPLDAVIEALVAQYAAPAPRRPSPQPFQ
jgi:AcrR family transcriptional regulator